MTDHQNQQGDVELDTFGRPVPRPAAQSDAVKTDAVNLVVPLIKATREPASKRATRPIDSPAGRIVSQVVRRDMDTGGMAGTINLATGLTYTLSYLVPALAQVHGHDPEQSGHRLATELRRRGGDDTMPQVIEKILSLDSSTVLLEVLRRDQAEFFNLILELADCAAAHAEMFAALEVLRRDQAEFFNLILELADCAAAHAEMFAASTKTPLDEVWTEIEEGLRD